METRLARIRRSGTINKLHRKLVCGHYFQLSQRAPLIHRNVERHAQAPGLRHSTASNGEPTRMKGQRSPFGAVSYTHLDVYKRQAEYRDLMADALTTDDVVDVE